MPVPAILQNPKLQASLAIFLFVTAWWLGNGALFMSEFGGGVTASFIFPIAGSLWWAGYKISYPAHKSAMVIGFALLALWSFSLLMVFASYKYATAPVPLGRVGHNGALNHWNRPHPPTPRPKLTQ